VKIFKYIDSFTIGGALGLFVGNSISNAILFKNLALGLLGGIVASLLFIVLMATVNYLRYRKVSK